MGNDGNKTGSDKSTGSRNDGEKGHDVVLLHSRTEDGEGIRALRSRPSRIDFTEIRPVKQGQPLAQGSEVIRLRPRNESALLYDVNVEFDTKDDTSQQAAGHAGPPCVASDTYRRNWDSVFGKHRRPPRKRDLN